MRRVLGPEHGKTLYTLEYLAIDISHEGRYSEAKNSSGTRSRRQLKQINRTSLASLGLTSPAGR
jgi:hypothetical protein